MYGVYKLNTKMSNVNSVPLDTLAKISKEEPSRRQSQIEDADSQINEICESCALIEQKWNTSKSVYKLVEHSTIFFNISLSLACVTLSCVYLVKFYSILNYLKEIQVLASALFVYYPFFYLCCEIGSLLLDLIRLFGTFQVLKLFRYETKQNHLIERKITRTDDFLINQTQNNKTMHTILNLKLRNKMRKKFKQLFSHLIWIEILVNIYFLLFVILNKIVTATYLKTNLINKLESDPIINYSSNITMFECCQQDEIDSNLTHLICYDDPEQIRCLKSNIDYYINLIISLFYSTAIFKLLIQLIFSVNLKVMLINDFINKNLNREEMLNKKYETCQVYLFTKSVQERIEHNARELAANLEKIKNEKSPLNKRDSFKVNAKNKITNVTQPQNVGNIHQVAYYGNDQNDY